MSTTYIARSSAVAARRLGDEMVMMSALDSTLFSLSDVAAVLWEAADGHTPLDQIVRDRVCSTYEVDHPTALRDAEEFVRALAAHGVLLVSDHPIEAPTAQASAASASGNSR
ncbi:MAG TPA: PqqD family protein [Candidatus Acidoferrales bacterium]|nr:PqqD family protein [Candidatus Acidoferrales bacterium]